MLKTIKRGVAAVAFLLGGTLIARGQQVLTVSNTEVPYNSPAAITINLSNSSPVSAVQFDLTLQAGGFLLPEVPDSIELSDRSDGHVAVLSRISETVLRLVVYSNSNKNFKGVDGKLLTIKCRSTSQPGSYAVSFSGTTVASATGQNMVHSTTPGTLTVQAPRLETSSPVGLGNIPLLSTYNNSLWIANRGNQDLLVSQVTSSGGDLTLSPPSLPQIVAPGSSTWLSYSLKPSVKGPFRHMVTVSSNDPDQPVKVIELTGVAYAVNTISLPTNLQGSYLGKLTVPINISNQEAFTGWQTTVQLPDDITYVEGSAKLADGRKPSDGVIAVSVNGNELMLVAYSPSLRPFTSNSGTVALFELLLNKKGGRYPLPLSQSVIGNEKGENILSGSSPGELSITAPELAVNSTYLDFGRITTREAAQRYLTLSNNGSEDLRIDGIDLNTPTVTFPTTFPITLPPGQSQSLLLNFQSAVPVSMETDLVIRSNDPMGSRKIRMTGATYSKNELHLRNAAGFSGGVIRIPLYLENFDPLQGIQFDIQLPSGYELAFADNPVRLGKQFGAFTVASNLAGTGVLRVVVYSLNGATIVPGNTILGEVLLKPASLLENYYGYVGINNVVLAGSSNSNMVSGASGTSISVCINKLSLTSSAGTSFCDSTLVAPQAGQVIAWYRNDTLLSSTDSAPYYVSQPGRYNAIVDHNGCSYFTSDLLLTNSKPETPVISAGGATTFCEGESVVLTSSASAGNIWYLNGSPINGVASNTFTAAGAGTYTVAVQENGCTSATSQAITVTVLPRRQPRITAGGPTSFCNGGSVVLTSSAATSYQWYRNWVLIPGATSQSFTATEQGYYYNQVSNTCGNGYDSVLVSVSATPVTLTTPVIRASGSVTFCVGNNVMLSIEQEQGVRYQWLKDEVRISGATGSAYSAMASGVYTVRAYNTCNNDSVTSIGLTIQVMDSPDKPVVTASGPIAFCNGGSVMLTSSPAANYQWYNGTTLIGGATNQSYTATGSGDYRVFTTNSCGNNTSNSVLVSVSLTPAVLSTPVVHYSGDTTFCPGNSILFYTRKLEGVLYQWFRDGEPITGATDTSFTATSYGGYAVRLYNTCNNDSVSSRSIAVNVLAYPDTPRITASGPLSFCNGSNVTLSSSTQSNYQWYKDGVAINGATSQSYTATTSGSYRIFTSNTCGSNGSDATAVSVNAIPVTPVVSLDTLKGELVSSNTTGNQWFFNGNPVSGATAQRYKPTLSGSYAVQSTSNGCASAMSSLFSYVITSVAPVDGSLIFRIAPNPVRDDLYLTFSGLRSDAYDLLVTDISGRVVKKVSRVRSRNRIPFSTLVPGVYVLKFSSPKDKTEYIVRVLKAD